jgi:hypothetical protein
MHIIILLLIYLKLKKKSKEIYDTLVNLVASKKDYTFRPYSTSYVLQCQSKVVFPIYPIPSSFLYTVNPVL